MQSVFINERKPCEISNQMFFNNFIFENKIWTGYDTKDCKIKLFSGAILHGACKKPESFLEGVFLQKQLLATSR